MIIFLIIVLGVTALISWGEMYIHADWMSLRVWLIGIAILFCITTYLMVRLST